MLTRPKPYIIIRLSFLLFLSAMSGMMRKLAGQTAVYGISTIVSKLLSYLLFPYLTYGIMSVEEYGMVGDMYRIIPIVLVILTMGLETAYFRFAAKAESAEGRKRLFGTLWLVTTAAALTFLALVIIFTPALADLMHYSDNPGYIQLVAMIIALDAISAVPFAKLRQEGRPGRFVIVRITSVLVNIAFVVFFLSGLPLLQQHFGGIWNDLWIADLKPGYFFLANVISNGVAFLMLVPTLRGIRFIIDWKVLGPVFLFSLPLLLSGIAGTANEFIDGQMIKYLMPADEAFASLGIFNAVSKVAVILVMFTYMYRLAAEPFFLSNFKGDDFRTANAEAMKYFIIVSLGIFLFIGLYSDLFMLLAGPDFRSGMSLLPVIMISNILSGIVLNLSFWYKQKEATRYAVYITFTGLVFTLVFNILLVPKLGIWGAAIARLICETVMVVVSYAFNRKHYPVPYDLRRIGGYVLLAAIIYSTVLITGGWPWFPRYCVNLLFLAVFAVYAVRRENIDVRATLRSIIK